MQNGSPFSYSYIPDWHISPNGYATKFNYLLPCKPVMGIKNLLALEAVIFQRSNRAVAHFCHLPIQVQIRLWIYLLYSNAP